MDSASTPSDRTRSLASPIRRSRVGNAPVPLGAAMAILDLEQRAERRARVVGLGALLGGVLDAHPRLQQRAVVALRLLRHRRTALDVTAALPARRGVEVRAVGAGVEIAVAVAALRVEPGRHRGRLRGAADGATEHLLAGGAE